MNSYDVKDVRRSANGRWLEVLASLGPSGLKPAIEKVGRHVPCPVKGGHDGFRLFPDADETGGGISNWAGTFPNGFLLLGWLNGWSFAETVNRVGEFLGVKPRQTSRQRQNRSASNSTEPKFKGRLVESGIRPCHLKPGQTPEFFCRIALEDRSFRTIWGEGIRRAVKASGADFGEEVLVSATTLSGVVEDGHPARVWRIDRLTDLDRVSAMERLWTNSMPLDKAAKEASPCVAYLEARSLSGLKLETLTDLRFNPKAICRETCGTESAWPALVAAVRDSSNRIVTLHRTFLASDGNGKAPVDVPRKLMKLPEGRTMVGAAIRLGGQPENGVLGVAEGIETALSVIKATGMPCWSLVSAGNLKSFTAPEGVHTVVVWADLDRSETGQKAALELKSKLEAEGIAVIIALPPMALPAKGTKKGWDWNDVLALVGERGFPPVSLFDQL